LPTTLIWKLYCLFFLLTACVYIIYYKVYKKKTFPIFFQNSFDYFVSEYFVFIC